MAEPLTPILVWLCEEQADITGKDLAEVAGIAQNTWSKVRQGKQDLSSDLLWKVLKAISILRPRSDAARVVALIEQKKYAPPAIRLSDVIESADEPELEAALLQIVRKLFPKASDNAGVHHLSERLKSPIV